jgi:26S proteasome regulatory subunit N7
MSKTESKKVVDDETASPYPVMDLAQQMHRVVVSKDPTLEVKVFETIVSELENPSLYTLLRDKLYHDKLDLPPSAAKLTAADLKSMEEKNAATLVELEAAVDEASTSAGDMEVLDARVAVARFAAKSLSHKEALEAYNKVLELPKLSSGKKIDTLMALARVSSFYSDTAATDEFMERAYKLAEAGGGADWDRRNRLKVYRSLQMLLHRDVKQAAGLLLDCIATFNAVECCTYTEFIVYTVLTNMLHLPRPDLKKKIIDGPEILSVSTEIPEVVRELMAFVLLTAFVQFMALAVPL